MRTTNFPMTNCPVSGHDQGHVTHSRILHAWNFAGTVEARVVKILCACRLCQILAFGQLTVPEGAWPRSCDQF